MGIVYFEIVDSLREIIEILFIYILRFCSSVKSKIYFQVPLIKIPLSCARSQLVNYIKFLYHFFYVYKFLYRLVNYVKFTMINEANGGKQRIT